MKKLFAIIMTGALVTGCGGVDSNQSDVETTTATIEINSEQQVKTDSQNTEVEEKQSPYNEMGLKIKGIIQNEIEEKEFIQLENYYGILQSDINDFYYAQSIDPMKADTVIVINAKDENKANEISEIIESVRKNTAEQYRSYAPEQFELIDKAKVNVKGNYVYYVYSMYSNNNFHSPRTY